MRLEFIPAWDLEERWSEAAPFIERALARQSGMSLESVKADIKRVKFFLWLIPGRAAIVTEIQHYALEKICVIVLCGGDGMDEWLHHADATLCRHARHFGCAAMMIVGREGWSRVLPEYRVQDVIMRKPL